METTMAAKLNKRTDMTMEEWAKRINVGCLYTDYDDDYDLRQYLKRKEEYEHALFLQEKEEELAKENALRESEHRRRHGIPEPDHSTDQTYSVANTIKNYFYKILK
jgi:hypothetical protein